MALDVFGAQGVLGLRHRLCWCVKNREDEGQHFICNQTIEKSWVDELGGDVFSSLQCEYGL